MFFPLLPDPQHIAHTDIQFAFRIIGQQRIHQSLIQTQLAAIAGDFQHIIHRRVYRPTVNSRSPIGQILHQVLLVLGRLHHHSFDLGFRYRQVQLISCFDIRHFLEHIHQLRKVEELCKSGSGSIPCTFRGQLNAGCGFPEGCRPGVEVGHSFLLQSAVLKVSHHGIKLGHAVADRRPRRKNHAAPAGQFVHVLAFHKHIRTALGFRCGKTGHIPHFCVEEQIFVRLRFIHKEPIHAQLFKGHHIVFLGGIVQFLQPGLQRLSCLFHLFDGKGLSPAVFHLSQGIFDLIDLPLQEPLLALPADGDLLKLGVSHDDSIIISGGDAATEFFPIVGLKIFLGSNQDFR